MLTGGSHVSDLVNTARNRMQVRRFPGLCDLPGQMWLTIAPRRFETTRSLSRFTPSYNPCNRAYEPGPRCRCSGRPRGERTTAQSAQARFVMLDTCRQSGEHVGEPHPRVLWKCKAKLQLGPALSHRRCTGSRDLLGMSHSGGVGKGDAVHSELDR